MTKNIGDRQRMDLEQARSSLAKIWFWGAGVSGLLVILQCILGRFEGYTQDFLAWFTPTVAPTLGLIIGVISSTAQDDDSGRTVKKFFFRAAAGLSVAYLIVLMLTMLLEPVAWTHDMKFYNLSSYWLGPIQGLVAAALGALFNSRKKTGA
jgi:hypothetical protein